MRIKFREGTILGDTYIIPAFDFDYETARAEIPGAFNTSGYNTSGIITVSGERFEKFKVVSNQLYKYLPANIPRPRSQYGDDGLEDAILPLNTNIQDGHVFDWAAKGGFEEITGGEPADFHTNPHYVFVYLTHPSSCYSDMRPTQSYRVQSDIWYTKSAGNTNLLDKMGKFGKVIYTDAGGHMSVYQNMYFDSYWQPKPVLIGNGPQAGGAYGQSSQNKVVYAVCNRNNVPLVNSQSEDNRYRMYFNEYNTLDGTLQSNIDAWRNKAQSYFFIHYTVNGEEMYGVCYAQFSGYGDADYPTRIGVIALGADWWGGSIVPGGGGSGTWGSQTVVAGGSGSFDAPSNSRGDSTGSGVAAIAATARSALDAFFTGTHGFKIHQILAADISDIFAQLYSSSFIDMFRVGMYTPLSAVLSMHLLPEKLLNITSSTSDLIISGYNVSANLPTPKPYPIISSISSLTAHESPTLALDTFDFGAYFDAFPDFAPYTDIYLHLPYIGTIQLDTNAVQHGRLRVDYICDAVSGNVAAYVWCEDLNGVSTYKYIATGNAAYSIPLFTMQQDGTPLGKIFTSGIGLASAAATGNAAGMLNAGIGVAAGLFDAATAQHSTQVVGTFNGNAGMISDSVCWLEIVRPQWVEPEHYQLLKGEISMLSGKLSDYGSGMPYEGYVQVQDIDTDGIQASADEIDQIEQILRSGIYVNAK